MLELKNISFDVMVNGQKKEILKNLNIKFDNNKFIVITGPNGSGKSTLAKIIAGIVLPTQGQILFDETDITDKSITERAKSGVGYAFQQPVKFKGLQVYDLLKVAAKGSLSLEQACNYLSKVGLCAGEYIRREVNGSLSGGELKRIEIATILAKQSKLSVFDEPEAGIDLWSFQNLTKIFNSMRQNINNGTIVVISHQERILEIADEILVLADGKITMQGSREEILPKILGTESAVTTCAKLN
ncbi:MAG: ATP-binding cassette domain-containing protein [Elusimicrobia bacterium]|jgi:Fe-S cluster assembly ATP-binding protein|nr:ATP-binding cassette domain-containing protein [Elusimicrobiota bacterium]